MEIFLTQPEAGTVQGLQKRPSFYQSAFIVALVVQCAVGVFFAPSVAYAAWSVASAVPQPNTFSVSAQDGLPRDVQFKVDGTKMYILGGVSNSVHEYNLSKAWSPTSASFVQSFSVSNEEIAVSAFFFRPDGTKMYVIGSTGQDVNEYTLSTPWDVSSAVFVQLFSVAGEESVPQGLFFRDDGIKMYIAGSTGDDVNEYTLSSAWNVSTAVFTRVSTQITQDTVPTGLFFKPDGTKLFVLGGGNDILREYNLTNPWNVSSVTFVKQFSVGGQETGPQGISFKDDGTKMYLTGSAGVDVNEYVLPSGFVKPQNNLGLVGYWSFNEATSTQATDFSGNGNHGTLENFDVPFSATSGWVSGKRAGALSFAGGTSNDSVNVGSLSALNGAQRATISAWVYDRSGAASKSIISRFNGGSPSFIFYTSDAGNGGGSSISFSPDGSENVFTTGSVHQTNRWEHWVAVFDGTQGTDLDKVTLYLNGVVQAEDITSTPLASAIDTSSDTVRIGADSDLCCEFNGIIDEVRVYNRALGPTEVMGLFGTGGGATRVSNSSKTLQQGTTLGNGLVGHWTFDGSDFTDKVYDGSGNGNNGYVFGIATTSMKTIGKLGQGAQFNGSGVSYVDVGSAAMLDNLTTMSVCTWVNRTSLATNYGDLVSKGTDGGGGWGLYTLANFEALGFQGPLDGVEYGGGGQFPTGTWVHVCATWDGGTVDGSILLYHNGAPTGQIFYESGNSFNDSAINLKIGGNPSGVNPVSARMDDVRLYNRVLTPAEVKQLYNLGQVRIRQ